MRWSPPPFRRQVVEAVRTSSPLSSDAEKTASQSPSVSIPPRRGSKVGDFCRTHKKLVIPVAAMVVLLPLLGLLALLGRNATAEGVQSPTVYPSPETYGAGNWSDAYTKAQAMVAKMTPEDMNAITVGVTDATNGCVGISGAAVSVAFPGFCLHDAGNGVRDTDGVNAYSSGISLGASWNATLAYERAQYMGAEFKKKGVNIALGPVVGPIGRVATGGRNWEAFGSDPYLEGVLGAQSVLGLQESVIACAKHFVAYEQETNRMPSGDNVMSTSANVDDQTMHETYLWPFQDLVYAGVGCVMGSYNRINDTYACENSKAINGLLKGELNFQGFVVSDWNAQHSSLESANAGLDMALPASAFWDTNQLSDAVTSEALNQSRLEDMATRIIATWVQFGQDDPSYPALGMGMPPDLVVPHNYTDGKDPAARSSLLQQAIESHVLVKNVGNTLPLQKPVVMSIFGYDAISQAVQSPSDATMQLFQQSWEGAGLSAAQFSEIASNQVVVNPPGTYQGVLLVGGGSGSNTPSYISAPYDAIQARAYEDGTAIFSDFSTNDPNVVGSTDTCLVFINEFASETFDRPSLADTNSDALVTNVAAQCSNTIVIIHNAGIRVVDAWIENANVTAVIFAHLPGQDAGRALVQILYGDVSPSGRLPYTVAKKATDYGDLAEPCQAQQGVSDPQCDFSEGNNIDYRAFLAASTTPRYEFGYGLTYTSFAYNDLSITVNVTATATDDTEQPVYVNGTTDNSKNDKIGIGGLLSLFDNVGTITASITNNGTVAAAEVAQLYLTIPGAATAVLRGFSKVMIAPGNSETVSFNLRLKDVCTWDTTRQMWVVPVGKYVVSVGRSVLDNALTSSFNTS